MSVLTTKKYIPLQQVLQNSKNYKINKKIHFIQYLLEVSDESGNIYKQITHMVQDTGITKVTIIATLKVLQQENYITRICRGHYKLWNINKLSELVATINNSTKTGSEN